ncbi:hypothetical protein HGM15179_018028 [Zosterops borbonicus]|uniref:Uncharacterized protein n=1 Tax=Zosterops borbonicus TaxID=364589 RepID=A0A8K1LCN9_9PASS|nr:hypothetical protein HGM15179_018028 [Zosterops borbonicus]
MEERLCFTKPWGSLIPVPLQDSEEHQAGTAGMGRNPWLVDERYQKLDGGSWNCRTSQQGKAVWGYSVEKTHSSAEKAAGAGHKWPGSSRAGKDELRIPGHASRWWKLLKFTGKCDQQVQGGDPTPLFSSSGTTSGVLCPVLGSTFQEAQGDTGEGPTEATKMRSLESALKGEIAGSGPG